VSLTHAFFVYLANASFCSIIKSRSAIQNQPEKVVVALRNSCCTGGTLQVSRRACVRFLGIESVRLSQELSSDVDKFSLIRKVIPMKSTAKKQTVYYHVTQFGDAANIMKTGKMRGGIIASEERKTHLRAGLSSRGYYVSLARSLSSRYVASNMAKTGGRCCVLMIDTDRITVGSNLLLSITRTLSERTLNTKNVSSQILSTSTFRTLLSGLFCLQNVAQRIRSSYPA